MFRIILFFWEVFVQKSESLRKIVMKHKNVFCQNKNKSFPRQVLENKYKIQLTIEKYKK